MSRRLSLAGQLLALQVVIICVVLVGVTAVTVAQSTHGAQEFRGGGRRRSPRRWPTPGSLRDAVDDNEVDYVRVAAETTRTNSGSASVVVARADRSVMASADPADLRRPVRHRRQHGARGPRLGRGAAVRRQPGRGGDGADPDRSPPRGRRVRGGHPAVPVASWTGWPAAAPNLLTYLGLASAIGIVGSLLVARRVKRQTLGMEPTEIAGLVEHRDAMLHGIREGVVGLDLRGRVTLINDEAIRLLHIPGDALGRTLDDLGVGEEMRDALLSGDE